MSLGLIVNTIIFLLLIPSGYGYSDRTEISMDPRGTMTLTLDKDTYQYDSIDWEKSRVKNEEDIRLSIRQNDLPQIKFNFPDVEKSMSSHQQTFQIPDIQRGAAVSPITLNFVVLLEGTEREAVTFREGQIMVSLKNNRLQFEFEGAGGPALDSSIVYPIRGKADLTI